MNIRSYLLQNLVSTRKQTLSLIASVTTIKIFLFIAIILFASKILIAQTGVITYPKITGYVGIIHPIITYSGNSTVYNFDGAYIGGLSTGINIWKSQRRGFSFEFVPFIRVAEGNNKVSNFLFHPGVLFALGKGYTLATRAAFETAGRYGFTPVLNKMLIKGEKNSFYVAIPMPARFGNNQPASLAVAFQCGIAF